MPNEPEEITPEAEAGGDERELVEVFDTQQESEAMVVRGLLESAGIDALMSALDAPQDVLPGVGGVVLRVPADQAEDARRIIEAYRQNPDSGPEPPFNADSAA